ncbi:MAG: hypothetical protein ABJJ37_13335 [Roseibium sp.]
MAAHEAAAKSNVAQRTRFERHDLNQSFLEARFDFVSAMFLQSSTPFSPNAVLRRAADAVTKSRLLLIVSHGSRAPWSWSDENTV